MCCARIKQTVVFDVFVFPQHLCRQHVMLSDQACSLVCEQKRKRLQCDLISSVRTPSDLDFCYDLANCMHERCVCVCVCVRVCVCVCVLTGVCNQ